MGTTLCNINLYNPDKTEYNAGENFTIVNVTEDWDTILETDDERDFDRISKLAATLSGALDTNAIVTIYFDDDVFGIDVYARGKMKAFYHNTYDGYESKNVSLMLRVLDLDIQSAKAFRYLLKKDMYAADAIHKLSAICRLPFYVDKFMYDHAPDNLISDMEPVLKEIEAEKAKAGRTSKSKNEAELICSIPGMAVDHLFDYDDAKNGIIRVVEPSGDLIDYSHICCYQVTNEPSPSFSKVFEYSYPFDKWAPGEAARVLAKLPDRILLYDNREVVVYEVFDDLMTDRIIETGQIPDNLLPAFKYEPIARDYVAASELPVNPGKVVNFAEAALRSSFSPVHYDKVKIEDGLIIRLGACHDFNKREQYLVVDFFNEDKKLIKTYLIPIDYSLEFYKLHSDYCYIEEKQQIIFGEYIIDLENRTFTVSDTLPANIGYITRRTLKNGQEVLVIQSGKNIMVFDMDYNPISVASIKGQIVAKMFDHEDNLYLVTSSNILALGFKYDYTPGDCISLYRIPLLPAVDKNSDI